MKCWWYASHCFFFSTVSLIHSSREEVLQFLFLLCYSQFLHKGSRMPNCKWEELHCVRIKVAVSEHCQNHSAQIVQGNSAHLLSNLKLTQLSKPAFTVIKTSISKYSRIPKPGVKLFRYIQGFSVRKRTHNLQLEWIFQFQDVFLFLNHSDKLSVRHNLTLWPLNASKQKGGMR